MRPSLTTAIEALGTLVEVKTWLTAASMAAFASSGRVDSARSAGLMVSEARVSKSRDFDMLALIVRGAGAPGFRHFGKCVYTTPAHWRIHHAYPQRVHPPGGRRGCFPSGFAAVGTGGRWQDWLLHHRPGPYFHGSLYARSAGQQEFENYRTGERPPR